MHVMPLHTDSVRLSIYFTLCISQHVVVINPDFFIQDREYRDMSAALRIWDLRSGICRHGGTCPFGNELPSITSTVRSFHYSHRTMPRSWVSEYFEYLLTNSAGAWMQGNISEAPVTRSEIVKAVSECIAIAMTERDEPFVPELEKVLQRLHSQHPAHNGPLQHVRIWFQNEAQRIIQGHRCIHATSAKSWTSKSVCARLYAGRVSEVHHCLSGVGGAPNMRQHGRAMLEVFGSLSDIERRLCMTLAELWNADVSSGPFRCRYATRYIALYTS